MQLLSVRSYALSKMYMYYCESIGSVTHICSKFVHASCLVEFWISWTHQSSWHASPSCINKTMTTHHKKSTSYNTKARRRAVHGWNSVDISSPFFANKSGQIYIIQSEVTTMLFNSCVHSACAPVCTVENSKLVIHSVHLDASKSVDTNIAMFFWL